jgi:hypothetical protein
MRELDDEENGRRSPPGVAAETNRHRRPAADENERHDDDAGADDEAAPLARCAQIKSIKINSNLKKIQKSMMEVVQSIRRRRATPTPAKVLAATDLPRCICDFSAVRDYRTLSSKP